MVVRFFIACIVILNAIAFGHKYPEEYMNVTQIIQSRGYPCEQYYTITEDGYLLSIQRIPHGKGQKYNNTRMPVLVQHGLLDSSNTWVMNSDIESLAFILADSGHDVWLSNSRGNMYSNRNIYIPVTKEKFWEFSFDEMAKYDLPAVMGLVLNTTGHQKLNYVGHSQGTLIAFIEFSQNQKLAAKVNKVAALAPFVTLTHMKGILDFVAPFTNEINLFAALVGINDFLPSDQFTRTIGRKACGGDFKWFCEELIMVICGPDWKNLNSSRVGIYLSHFPAGTSRQNLVHYGQLVETSGTHEYNYGYVGNLEHYHSLDAPSYNISRYNVATALFSGSNDFLANPGDVDVLRSLIPHAIKKDVVMDGWNHMDFVWGDKAYQSVYADVVSFFGDS